MEMICCKIQTLILMFALFQDRVANTPALTVELAQAITVFIERANENHWARIQLPISQVNESAAQNPSTEISYRAANLDTTYIREVVEMLDYLRTVAPDVYQNLKVHGTRLVQKLIEQLDKNDKLID